MSKKRIKKIISVMMIIYIYIWSYAVPIYADTTNSHEKTSYINGIMVATDDAKISINDREEEDVQVETVSPSTENKIKEALTVPANTIIFYSGIIILLLIALTITILKGKRRNKKENPPKE